MEYTLKGACSKENSLDALCCWNLSYLREGVSSSFYLIAGRIGSGEDFVGIGIAT